VNRGKGEMEGDKLKTNNVLWSQINLCICIGIHAMKLYKIIKKRRLKITKVKWTEGVVQAVQHLLCKHEALSSNPSPTIKKKFILSSSNIIK
jgi:hypothetical protein